MFNITTGDMMHVYGAFGTNTDYTARITVRMADQINAAMLQKALLMTQQRYPYFSVQLARDENRIYYKENSLPIALLHTDSRVTLNCAEVNRHVWAVCYEEDRIHLDFFHGITDGTGMYHVLATLLYYYCRECYGVTEHTGIRIAEDPITNEELADPQDALAFDERPDIRTADWAPAFTLETDGGLTPSEPTIWDIEIPEDAFIKFTSANDASPGTMVSLLLARTIDELYPRRNKDIISAYVINARPMLNASETYHNCLGMAMFDYSDRLKSMPFTAQCTIYRGKTFIQSDADRIIASMTSNAHAIRRIAENAAAPDQKEQAFARMFNGGEGLISFLVSYTGKWKHEELGRYMLEFWAHPPNTFSLMAEIGAAGGRIFISLQQRFKEDTVREGFLKQLDRYGIPYEVKHVSGSDNAMLHF